MSNGFHQDGDLRATLAEDCASVAVEEYRAGTWHGVDYDYCTAANIDVVLTRAGYLVGEWSDRDGVVRVPLRRYEQAVA
jgi:hypothetical protein